MHIMFFNFRIRFAVTFNKHAFGRELNIAQSCIDVCKAVLIAMLECTSDRIVNNIIMKGAAEQVKRERGGLMRGG